MILINWREGKKKDFNILVLLCQNLGNVKTLQVLLGSVQTFEEDQVSLRSFFSVPVKNF